MQIIKIKNIFAAVFEKSTLDPLLVVLDSKSVRFWGTEGTVEYVKTRGYNAKSVLSGFDFDGRVKSIDKKVFAAILADRSKKSHLLELEKLGLGPFDLVVVDLYKLNRKNFPENMDIGGQALIRAVIKNYKNIALAFDVKSIQDLASELKKNRGSITLEFRKALAQKAAKFIAERTKLEANLFHRGVV